MLRSITLRGFPKSPLRPGRRLVLNGGRQYSALISTSRAQANSPKVTSQTLYHPWSPSLAIAFPPLYLLGHHAAFHSTPANHGGPLIPILATLLKASTGFELARTASRIALTFFPLIWFKNFRAVRMIKYAAIHGHPASEEKKEKLMKKIQKRKRVLQFLLFIPFILFWATIIASLERTPLTGRWRMILLSPDEEDEIAARLAGQGWYTAINAILAEEGSPKAIPATDWRYKWVYDTLRKLESSIPVLAQEPELCPNWAEQGRDCKPLPPPADFPLRPRPRALEYLHRLCSRLTEEECPKAVAGTTHGPTGAPYSLLVIDKPDASNAFSYGFGPDGGSGIVVYSGFLDHIFAKYPAQSPPHQRVQPSIWNKLLGGILPSSSSLASQHPTPTPEQTAELAILLAHEMAHLILAHHLESLSSVTIIVPGTLSIASDVVRVLIFPVTMLFGPFVNDAVAQLGKVGSGELLKISEACTSTKQEIEADVVSARLLAHAGFDARDAVRFWEDRVGTGVDCAAHGHAETSTEPMKVARSIMGTSHHPGHDTRVKCLKEELARWETERQRAIANDPTTTTTPRPRFTSSHPSAPH